MKKIFYLAAALLVLSPAVRAQLIEAGSSSNNSISFQLSEQLLKQGLKKKRNAMILFSCGLVTMATGKLVQKNNGAGVMEQSDATKFRPESKPFLSSILMLAGGAMTLTSIPIYISGSKKIKEAKLVMGMEDLKIPRLQGGNFKLVSIGIVTAIN